MKKLFSLSLLMLVSLTMFAGVKEKNNVMCTIVVSPCDGVANTLIEGEATEEQIRQAQQKMLHDCGMD